MDNNVGLPELPTLDETFVQDGCRRSTSDAAIFSLKQSLGKYVKPILINSPDRQLSNVELVAIEVY